MQILPPRYFARLAQLVEQVAVNHRVVGSSPATGAHFLGERRMKVRIDYSHYVIVDVPGSIIKQNEDRLFEILEAYVPEGAEIEGWEHPDLPKENEE